MIESYMGQRKTFKVNAFEMAELNNLENDNSREGKVFFLTVYVRSSDTIVKAFDMCYNLVVSRLAITDLEIRETLEL